MSSPGKTCNKTQECAYICHQNRYHTTFEKSRPRSQFWGTVLPVVMLFSSVAQALPKPEGLSNKMWTERHELPGLWAESASGPPIQWAAQKFIANEALFWCKFLIYWMQSPESCRALDKQYFFLYIELLLIPKSKLCMEDMIYNFFLLSWTQHIIEHQWKRPFIKISNLVSCFSEISKTHSIVFADSK